MIVQKQKGRTLEPQTVILEILVQIHKYRQFEILTAIKIHLSTKQTKINVSRLFNAPVGKRPKLAAF